MNALLNNGFSEGDVFTAGIISSTSSVNGITTTVNSNTLTKLAHAGTDLTSQTIASSTNETTIGTVTVTGGTISTGVFIMASLIAESGAAGNQSTFRLKTGVASSEATRVTKILNGALNAKVGDCIAWYDAAADYSSDVNIIVTGENNVNGATSKSTCTSIIVFGI